MTDNSIPKKRYINLEALREKLGGRSESAIRRDINAGRLPKALRLGGVRYWDEAKLDDHLDALAREQGGA